VISEAACIHIYMDVCVCVCVCEIRVKKNLAVHCAALVRKKKVRFFSLVQDTHKEIN
jgi:hypothetical protein